MENKITKYKYLEREELEGTGKKERKWSTLLLDGNVNYCGPR